MVTLSARKKAAKAAIDCAIKAALRSIPRHNSRVRRAFERMLHTVRRRSTLLSPALNGGKLETSGLGAVIGGLLALASQTRYWRRELDEWVPVSGGEQAQFASLARHLVAIYPVPAFMTSVWLKGQTPEARRQQGWFIDIGAGKNARKSNLPLRYTKMMAHHFQDAPVHLTVEQALRWGQVLGLGGAPRLALALGETRLGSTFEHEPFWKTVVQFFVNHPEFELSHLGLVVEYLHNQRFVSEEAIIEGEERIDLGPPQPRLCMKGRTPQSLLRNAIEWRQQSRRPKNAVQWQPSGIKGWTYAEQDAHGYVRYWTIQELTTAEALCREGDAMRHCVASYIRSCFRGESTIWSMRLEHRDRQFRVMTIEVDPKTRTICQACRRGNAPPSEKAHRFMCEWAREAGLKQINQPDEIPVPV